VSRGGRGESMNWLLALLAFAGLMAVLSTVVTAAVEALHKLFSLRQAGLGEMLRALHDSVIVNIENGARTQAQRQALARAGGSSKDARKFAADVTRSPAFGGGGRWWWPANWNLNISQRRFERLTHRQFAEQLAQTNFGQKLAECDRDKVRQALARTMYEFDRFGVAQSQFFRRRAKVFSGVVAFAFVAFANFDAVKVYIHLANSEDSVNKVLALVGVEDAEDLAAATVSARERVERLLADINAKQAAGSTEVSEQEEAKLRSASLALNSLVTDMRRGADLPTGREFFPYCEVAESDPTRCIGLDADAGRVSFFGLSGFDQKPLYWSEPLVRLVRSPGDALVWLLSIIATAGLLALGSPFWFDAFGRLASLARASTPASKALDVPDPESAEVTKHASIMRGSEEPGLEELTDAFLLASGVTSMPKPGSHPIGTRLGAPSSALVAEVKAPVVSPAAATPAPAQQPAVRQVSVPRGRRA
jgi:hypothetical protein